MNLLKQLETEQMSALRGKKPHPEFRPGDTVKVNVKVADATYDEKTKQMKTRERLQAFEGVCISRAGEGINESFTVRKLSYGEGVERVFPIYSPLVEFRAGRPQGQGPAREALLPARPSRQICPHHRAGRARKGHYRQRASVNPPGTNRPKIEVRTPSPEFFVIVRPSPRKWGPGEFNPAPKSKILGHGERS